MSHPEHFHTPKGTKLYLMAIQGKPYLPVQERIIWFREEVPKGRIMTKLISRDATTTVARATIYDESGSVMAQAHKVETKEGFGDHTEKAETGAIGRALALCGFGTQFTALEFSEGQRLADAPSPRGEANTSVKGTVLDAVMKPAVKPAKPKEAPKYPGDHVVRIGKKYVGEKIKDINPNDLMSFMEWIHTKSDAKFRAHADTQEFLFYAENFLNEAPMPEMEELDRALKVSFDKDEPLPF